MMADIRSRRHRRTPRFSRSARRLVMPGCRITRNFHGRLARASLCQCPHCAEYQVLEWDNLLATLDPSSPDDAHFTCVACGCVIEEERPAGTARDLSVARTQSERRQTASLVLALERVLLFADLAARSRANGCAHGRPGDLKRLSGTTLWAKPTRPRAKAGRPRSLRRARPRAITNAATVPQGALILTLGIDCQLDRCEWVLLGHGEHYKRFVIDCGTIGKHISEPDAQRNSICFWRANGRTSAAGRSASRSRRLMRVTRLTT